jgi:outer membrane protein TolC
MITTPKISTFAGFAIVPYVAAAIFNLALQNVAAADPYSVTFQPDAFGTRKALGQRTIGLTDPFDHACTAPAGVLSLPAAIDLALCRNPSTRTAWAAAHQQAAALGSAESAWLPSLTGTGSVVRVEGDHVDVSGNSVTHPETTRDAALNLSWVLYDFGGRGAHVRSARSLLDAAASTVSWTSQQTVFNVAQNYYGVVAADASLVAATTTEANGQRLVQITTALQKGGVASLADVLQAETAYDQTVLARVQAELRTKTVRGTLASSIGLPAEQPFQVAAEPVPSDVPALTTHLAELMTQAARQRPDLNAALAQRDAAEANVTVARAVGRPSISIGANHTTIDTTGLPRQNYDQVGVYLSVPFFSGFSAGYGVRQAQAELQTSEVNAEQIRLNVSLDVWNAYYGLEFANQQLGATATLIKAAENNEQVSLGRYQSGVGTLLDVLTAQNAASSARQLRIAAVLNWLVARAQLVLALGRLSGAEPLAFGGAPP